MFTNFDELNVRWWPKERNYIQNPEYKHNHDHYILYNGDNDVSEYDMAHMLGIGYYELK